ncbi:caspase family protein [Candidatus Obscuribacterales bacterium]|nr:caspase family protein [Candidatus Obscuribacterales bacterium]
MRYRFLVLVLILLLSSFASIAPCNAYRPQLVTQAGHTDKITQIQFSKNNQTLITASDDKTVRIWNTASGRQLYCLSGHVGSPGFYLSPDEATVVTYCSVDDRGDGTISGWDVASGRQLWTDSTYGFSSLTFSPDSRILVFCSEYGSTTAYETRAGKEISWKLGGSCVSCAFSPDGQWLATIVVDDNNSDNHLLVVWDYRRGVKRLSSSKFKDISEVHFSKKSPSTLSVFHKHGAAVTIWDVAANREIASKDSPSSSSFVIKQGSDDLIANQGETGLVTLWSLSTLKPLAQFTSSMGTSIGVAGKNIVVVNGNPSKVFVLPDKSPRIEIPDKGNATLSADGNKVAFADDFGSIKIWSVQTQKIECEIRAQPRVTTLAFSPDGRVLVTASNDNLIRKFDLSGHKEFVLIDAHGAPVTSLAFEPSKGGQFATADEDGKINIWDSESDKRLHTVSESKPVRKITYNRDGSLLACLTDDCVSVWDTTKWERKHTQPASASDVVFTPDTRYLLWSDSYSGAVTMFDLVHSDGWPKRTSVEGCRLLVTSDGSSLISAGFITKYNWCRMVSPIDAGLCESETDEQRNLRKRQELHLPPVGAWSLCPNNERIAVAGRFNFLGDGKLLFITEAREDGKTIELSGHTSFVNAVEFNRDGTILASGSDDGTVRLWNTSDGREIACILSLGKNSWAAVTPDGRFDASPSGMQMLHYKVGTDIVDLKQFKDYFYEPSLLSKLTGFQKRPLYKIPSFDNVALCPDVSANLDENTSQLRIHLTDKGGGFGKVIVKVNGSEFNLDPSFLAMARSATATKSSTIDLPPINLAKAKNLMDGEHNEVTISAYNSDGLLQSREVRRVWTKVAEKAPEPLEVYALIAGVSKYANQDLDLKFSAKDASDFATAVQIAGSRLVGKDKTHITLLATSDDQRAIPPTKENFLKAFASLQKTRPNDIVLVYLAGHGMCVSNSENAGTNHTYCYLTQDAYTTSLNTPELRSNCSITSDELRNLMRADKLAANKKVLILDTCAAGMVMDGLSLQRTSAGDQKKAVEALKDRAGFHVLMGCSGDRVSYEASKYGQGLLTHALLSGMRGAGLKDWKADKVVDVQTLFEYAVETVPKLAQGLSGQQEPRLAIPENSTSFWFGKLTQDDMSAIPIENSQKVILKPMFLNRKEGIDDLNLTLSVTQECTSFATSRGGESEGAGGLFVPVEHMAGGFRPTGTYTIENGMVSLELVISRDGEKLHSSTITQSQDSIAAAVAKYIRDFVTTFAPSN